MNRRFRTALALSVVLAVPAGSALLASPPPPPYLIETSNIWHTGCGPMYSHDLLVDIYVNDSKKVSAARWNPVGKYPAELWKGSGNVGGSKLGIVMYLVPKDGTVANAIRTVPLQSWTIPSGTDDGNGYSYTFSWMDCPECKSVGKCSHGLDQRTDRVAITVNASTRANRIGVYCTCYCRGTTHCYEF